MPLVVNEEVDWDLEMGAIVRRTCEKKGPAVFFKNIKDYPGFECVGAPIATYRRLAIVFGMDPDTPIPEISAEYLTQDYREVLSPKGGQRMHPVRKLFSRAMTQTL